MSDKTKNVATTASAETLAALNQQFPQESSYSRKIFPRLNFKSQDVMEGKGKNKKVVTEAGTFIIERQTDEIDPDTGKNIWEKNEVGLEIPECQIIYQRKQLRHFDEATEEYTSSPIYDTEEDVVPLFCGKKKIAEGLPKDLKAMYQYTTDDGKIRSKLEENRILYVLIDEEMHQLNLRGSSMYSFLTFARKNQTNSLIINLSSTAEEKGSIEWNQMTFTPVRVVTEEEAQEVISLVQDIQDSIKEEKEFYAAQQMGDASAVITTSEAPALAAGKKDDDDF
jgi:hypothetical protein